MIHLHPATINVSPSENNNNNSDSSQTIAFNAKITERKFSDDPLHNGKEITTAIKEKTSMLIPKYKNDESSPNKKDNSSSALVSPMSHKLSCPSIMEPLQPLSIPEQCIIRPKSASMDIDGSRDSSMDTNEKQQLINIDARMQRERARILGGYNTLSNASRIREDQVICYSVSSLSMYVSCL